MNKCDIFIKLDLWLVQNKHKSYDICDINATYFYKLINMLKRRIPFVKYFLFPFYYASKRYPGLIRKILKINKQMFPQAQAITSRAYLAQYKHTKDEIWLDKAKANLDWLIDNRVITFANYCWGQPYDWYSKQEVLANTPRATVTSQVADAFLDAYEVTKDKKYLDIAVSTCHFFINDLNWMYDDEEHLCFSYTTEDNYTIHNASMLASSVLIRTWSHCKNSEFKKMGLKALDYTMKYQNNDGSWYYWVLPDNQPNKIDNYHTGFVLESLEIIKTCLGDEFLYKESLKRGISYYIDNLFEDGYIPKITNKELYPIDIQSCAQSIITFGIIGKRCPDLKERLDDIIEWTCKEMYSPEGFFYYRIYNNGWKDKTPYIRWAESWMLRALTFKN